jgi:hypothetical protein
MKSVRSIAFAVLALAACGERPEVFDAPIQHPVPSFGLEGRVALVDNPAHRVVLLSPRAGQGLDRIRVPIGHNVIRTEVSSDRRRLFVLSAGDLPRRKEGDERPSLTIVEGDGARRLELESPHSGFMLDPLGRYLALFAAPAGAGAGAPQTSFVENPNEIVIVDLQAPPEAAVTSRTIRSFGGRPQRVTFTRELLLPGGPRRLLVVETDQDITLLDLDNVRATPQRPEITVRLTSGANPVALRPAGVVVDDGEPERSDDARIGVRIEGNPNVFTLTLVPAAEGTEPAEPNTIPNDFRPEINLTDVGGPPGDIAFVRTEVGLRLAAVVPGTRSAVLVDPQTSIATNVEISAAYSRMSLITDVVGGVAGSDTALLYGSGGSGGIAFWSLGRATGDRPFRSVEIVPLTVPIEQVLDVPPPRPELKVLQAAGASQFFVLNLASRTAAPLTTLGSPTLHVADDGQRLWAFRRGDRVGSLARVTLDDLHPVAVPLDRQIDAVYDVARADGGRALVAIDPNGAIGATVLDALDPDTTTSRSYYGLLLEDLR